MPSWGLEGFMGKTWAGLVQVFDIGIEPPPAPPVPPSTAGAPPVPLPPIPAPAFAVPPVPPSFAAPPPPVASLPAPPAFIDVASAAVSPQPSKVRNDRISQRLWAIGASSWRNHTKGRMEVRRSCP